VGVLVPAGTHVVAFTYEEYPNYVVLFLAGFAAVAALVYLDRRWRDRRLAPIVPPPLFPDHEPAAEDPTVEGDAIVDSDEPSEGDAVDEHPVAFGAGGLTGDA
jgi:hypothetical protein